MSGPADHRAARVAFLLVGAPLTALAILLTAVTATGTLARATTSTPIAFDQPVTSVRIEVARGSVTVRGRDVDRVVGERIAVRGLQEPHLTERVEGDQLVLSATCFPVGNTWCEVSYVLDVPRGTAVEVHAALADIRVADIDDAVEAWSVTGAVTVERVAGPVRLGSGTGALRVDELRSTTVEARTGVGAIDLAFTTPPTLVVAESGAGSVDVEVPGGDTAYRVEVPPDGPSAPRVAVPTSPTSEHVLRLSTQAGTVSVHQPEA